MDFTNRYHFRGNCIELLRVLKTGWEAPEGYLEEVALICGQVLIESESVRAKRRAWEVLEELKKRGVLDNVIAKLKSQNRTG